MGPQRFRAVIAAVSGNRAVIVVPFDPDEMWGAKADHPVGGTIDGRRVRGRLAPGGSGWVLTVTPMWLRDTGAAIGDDGPARPGDVVGRYQDGLAAGDTDAVVRTFAPSGYFRGPFGPHCDHRGTAELRSFFARCFSAGGGIGLQHCAVTDDGVRCALEYNCVRWGSHDLPPQAGIGVYERGPDGLLAAARVYDDVEAPVGQP